MAGKISDYLAGEWLEMLYATPAFGALFTSDPRVEDPLNVEVQGLGYTRPHIEWSQSFRALVSTNLLRWTNLPEGTVIRAVGAFDAAVNGNLLFSGLLETPRNYAQSGGVMELPVGSIVVSVDLLFGTG